MSCGQFEYGASWERPNLLPIWEAQVCKSMIFTRCLLTAVSFVSQFGDFFNGAQVGGTVECLVYVVLMFIEGYHRYVCGFC